MKKVLIGNATLFCGDCLDVMAELEPSDIVVTSPPYNMGLSPGGNGRGMYRPGANTKGGRFRSGYGVFDDAMPQVDYDKWQRRCLTEMYRLCRMAVFYNHRPRVEHGLARLPLSMDFGEIPLRQIIIWDRKTGIDVNLRSFCTRQEWILLFARSDFKLKDHSASGTGDIWRLGIETKRTGHPAPFPVSLPQTAISTTGATSVLDPFMGSGTTGVAAARLGAKFTGIELDPKWFDIACGRVEAAQQTPVDMFATSAV